MNIAIVIPVVLVVIVVLVLLVRTRIVPNNSVSVNDIPEIINQLQRSGRDGNFAVLMFVPPDSTDGTAFNLQYSIEGTTVGLDWVLLSPRNIADKAKIIEIASNQGHRFEEHEMNKVHYLRVTGSGIAELGAKIIQDFYKIDPTTKLQMIAEGFDWQPSPARPVPTGSAPV